MPYSPLTSLQMEDVLKINCFSREDEHGLAHNFFSIDELKEEKLCFEAYKNLYHRACAIDQLKNQINNAEENKKNETTV